MFQTHRKEKDAVNGRTNAVFGIAISSVIVIISQLYVYDHYPTYNLTTLVVGVLAPLAAASLLLIALKQKILLLAFIAMFWSLIDDAPVFFDSVYTWPQVTRFHPFLPHLILEIVLHALTFAFILLALFVSLGGKMKGGTTKETAKIYVLALIAFFLCYAQNIPLASIVTLVETNWYLLDVVEHAAASLFLYLAIREALRARKTLLAANAQVGQ